jgi:hypothetical protein
MMEQLSNIRCEYCDKFKASPKNGCPYATMHGTIGSCVKDKDNPICKNKSDKCGDFKEMNK